MASQGTRWVLPAPGVSFFAARNLQAFLLLPVQMDPCAPQEGGAERGLQSNLSHLSYPEIIRSLHGVPLETGIMCLLLSSRHSVWPHACFPVPDTTSNALPVAAGLSALMPPPTTAYSPPPPLKDGVAWGLRLSDLCHMKAALLMA